MPVRPSKGLLYSHLKKFLKVNGQGIVLDAASANFSNRRFFKCQKYVGVDRSIELLKRGLSHFPNDIGILGDLVTIKFPVGSFDAVVSTNTLYHISDPEKRSSAIQNLIEAVSPEGFFFLQMEVDSSLVDCEKILKANFGKIFIRPYGNKLSQMYEALLSNPRNNGLPYAFFESYIMKIFAYFLVLIEQIDKFSFGKNKVYYLCSEKINKTKNDFNMQPFKKIGEGLYE